jgi:hypothetical protein
MQENSFVHPVCALFLAISFLAYIHATVCYTTVEKKYERISF